MTAPAVSFVLLTYNQSDTVAEAIKGALMQNGAPLEIVISDDGSKDSTFAVIEETVKGYVGPHKIILNQNPKNLGLAGNIERAHQLATGELIIAAAGDDISLPQRTQQIVKAFESSGAMLVCSRAHVIDPEGKPLSGQFHSATFYHTTDLAKVARSKSLYIGATGAWRRTLYEDYGPLDPDAYEDLVMGFRAALEGKIHVIEEPLVKYRLGQGMTSSDQYFSTVDAFRERRRKGFVANEAIMRQRILDARTSGIVAGSEIMKILEREKLRAKIGRTFYDPQGTAFLGHALRHPLLALHTWHSERRRIRKTQKRIAAEGSQAHG